MSLQSPPQICPALYNHLFSPPSTGNASHLRLLLLFLPHRKVSLLRIRAQQFSKVLLYCCWCCCCDCLPWPSSLSCLVEEQTNQHCFGGTIETRLENSIQCAIHSQNPHHHQLWMLLLFSYLLSTSTIASRRLKLRFLTTTNNNNNSSSRRRSRTRRAIELTIYVQRLIISCTTHCTAQTRLQRYLKWVSNFPL